MCLQVFVEFENPHTENGFKVDVQSTCLLHSPQDLERKSRASRTLLLGRLPESQACEGGHHPVLCFLLCEIVQGQETLYLKLRW